ncbi:MULTISPECIES: hypothetical protein [unclassified Saccharibacter]|uniref:hypothetical protein n=1 Tax=unclassified Saccharibacter TaxID=2648722 RepID=UPI0013294057|nr:MULTISPECIES: hypothetical protein [unclassified Saccharibacter]MXV35332.1 hypothetical protein [Saccharibacter sp. EH611]MXV57820.1 hypothetical protein [Saccharibacter sp. EH70]MXV65266.1 hypothetical protein [Saccharibacter sp. EH60]
MLPLTSTPGNLETTIIAHLRQNALTESSLLIERLQGGETHTFLKGWLLFLQGKVGEAAKEFSSLSAFTPLHPCILIQQEIRTDLVEKRFLELLDAVEIHESHTPILSELRALSLLQLGFLKDAEKVARCALRRCPNHLALQNALATILGERGAFSEALSILEKLCDDYPDRWQPLNNLACTLNDIGLMDKAIDPTAVLLCCHRRSLSFVSITQLLF